MQENADKGEHFSDGVEASTHTRRGYLRSLMDVIALRNIQLPDWGGIAIITDTGLKIGKIIPTTDGCTLFAVELVQGVESISGPTGDVNILDEKYLCPEIGLWYEAYVSVGRDGEEKKVRFMVTYKEEN